MTGVDKYGMPAFFGHVVGWYFVPVSDLRDFYVLNSENSARRQQEKQQQTEESL